MKIKVCGYADDTAVYVQSPREVSDVMRTLTRFGAVSGLVTNTAKSVAVPLCDGVTIDPILMHGVRLGRTVRDNWNACLVALNARLVLARRKTNTVRSRAELAAASVIPKSLVKRFIWGSRLGVPFRTWVSDAQAGNGAAGNGQHRGG
uniref:Uncharacterized protein n=1 Tax=Hyaloperonospora arabidopsidis (strain Emoy2) TaxID=559515 RepID=M4B7Y5_HYAAE